MTTAADKIAAVRATLTTPGSWGRPRFLLDHEVDPTVLALYRANPEGFNFIDGSAVTQFEALHIPSQIARALASASSLSHAEGRASKPSVYIEPSDLADMTEADREALAELASLLIDQNPYLREMEVRRFPIWSLPAEDADGPPDGTWNHALDAVSRGLPVATIERAVNEAVKVRKIDPSVSPTEIGVLFTGFAPPEEVSTKVFGVTPESSGGLVLPVVVGAGAGYAAAMVFGGPVGWAVGGTVAAIWWLLS